MRNEISMNYGEKLLCRDYLKVCGKTLVFNNFKILVFSFTGLWIKDLSNWLYDYIHVNFSEYFSCPFWLLPPKINKTARMVKGKNGRNKNICTLDIFHCSFLQLPSKFSKTSKMYLDINVAAPRHEFTSLSHFLIQ